MKCRKILGDVKTVAWKMSRDESGGLPDYRSDGIRHIGGVNLNQALVRNVRTCRPNVKGAAQVAKSTRARVPKWGTGAERLVVGLKVL